MYLDHKRCAVELNLKVVFDGHHVQQIDRQRVLGSANVAAGIILLIQHLLCMVFDDKIDG